MKSLKRSIEMRHRTITENNVLTAFRELVWRRRIPKYYPQEFLEGIKVDILGTGSPNIYTLYKYKL